jgi:hypothetical protein
MCLEEWKKTMKYVIQDRECPAQNSNLTPLEYISEALPIFLALLVRGERISSGSVQGLDITWW